MDNIKIYNTIADEGLHILRKRFFVGAHPEQPIGIILRSFDLHEEPIADSVLAIARAGAGTNNIPKDQCTERGIVVFNTPGANANAVKELAMTALFLSSRNIIGGIEWVKNLQGDDIPAQVEKGKSQFKGPEIYGKTLGVIGLGAIGVMVSNAALDLGMEVYGYDPYLSVDAAWGLSRNVKRAEQIETIFQECDYISIHVPMTPQTAGMLNKDTFAQMKEGVRLINLARGELVVDQDLLAALNSGQVHTYVSDFPNEHLINHKQVIAIPHLGASTPESEVNCAVMAAKYLKEFLEHGNIYKSVNFPSVELPRSADYRITFCHKNIPNMLGQISGIMAAEGINIVNLINKSRGNIAYTIMDIEQPASPEALERLHQIVGMIRLRCVYTDE